MIAVAIHACTIVDGTRRRWLQAGSFSLACTDESGRLALGSDGGVRLTACLFALPALASVFFFVLSSLSRVLTSGKGTMFPLGCPSIPQVMQP